LNPVLALSGRRQAALVRDGEISPAELFDLHRRRIAEVNPQLNAVIELFDDPGAASDGPFRGVPFSVKDSISIAGYPTTAGTLGYASASRAERDATVVRRLRSAGAVPIARTNLPDLLFSFETDNLIYGRTANPYDTARTPGGSSGGDAALIAAGGVPFGLGSDSAGSVRLPAHFCGIASLKPTSGRLPRTGHVPPAGGWIESLWQIGPMARRVEDLCALMPLLAGADGRDRTAIPAPLDDPFAIDVSALRIAWFADNGIIAPDPETADVVERAAVAVGARHARPPGVERSYDLEMRFLGPDGGDGIRDFLRDIGSTPHHRLLEGWLAKLEPFRTDIAGFAQLWSELDDFRNQMFAFLRDYDAVLSPVAALPAVPHGTSIDDNVFPGFSYTMTHNLTGWPAAVVRCGATSTGLPIGVQVAAAPWREDIALAVALRLEERFGGWQPPPI
jgi:amidase